MPRRVLKKLVEQPVILDFAPVRVGKPVDLKEKVRELQAVEISLLLTHQFPLSCNLKKQTLRSSLVDAKRLCSRLPDGDRGPDTIFEKGLYFLRQIRHGMSPVPKWFPYGHPAFLDNLPFRIELFPAWTQTPTNSVDIRLKSTFK